MCGMLCCLSCNCPNLLVYFPSHIHIPYTEHDSARADAYGVHSHIEHDGTDVLSERQPVTESAADASKCKAASTGMVRMQHLELVSRFTCASLAVYSQRLTNTSL
jgi:hypothetical protein